MSESEDDGEWTGSSLLPKLVTGGIKPSAMDILVKITLQQIAAKLRHTTRRQSSRRCAIPKDANTSNPTGTRPIERDLGTAPNIRINPRLHRASSGLESTLTSPNQTARQTRQQTKRVRAQRETNGHIQFQHRARPNTRSRSLQDTKTLRTQRP